MKVSLDLTHEQAFVLFDWLYRTHEAGEPAAFVDTSERQLMWDLEAELETCITEPYGGGRSYAEALADARDAVRIDWEK